MSGPLDDIRDEVWRAAALDLSEHTVVDIVGDETVINDALLELAGDILDLIPPAVATCARAIAEGLSVPDEWTVSPHLGATPHLTVSRPGFAPGYMRPVAKPGSLIAWQWCWSCQRYDHRHRDATTVTAQASLDELVAHLTTEAAS